MSADVLNDLLRMTNRLGEPERDYVILGEGNTSARAERGEMYVTASGTELRSARPESFVRVSLDRALGLLDLHAPTDEQIRDALIATKTDGQREPRPSVETPVHAVFLSQPGVSFVGHTHPAAINMLTCSKQFEEWATRRLFPDEVVMCGTAPMLVPYEDPGIPLARVIKGCLAEYHAERGRPPKVVLMQNHGMTALGASARDVENITQMAVKAARILAGTFAFGGPRFLPKKHVARIDQRLDEHYRQRIIMERERT
ncbi:MAG: class II aldolase/adducin family protein [Phycisphaerales bacterium]